MRSSLITFALVLVALAAGAALRPTLEGFAAAPEESQGLDLDFGHVGCDADHEGHDHSAHDHDEHDDEHENIVALSVEAIGNLRLRMEPVALTDYTRTLRIPGEVVELPGVSKGEIAAPVAGVVTEVMALPGMSVLPGDPLFKMRVIDERLLDAQLQWLKTLTRLDIVNRELERLAPYASSGAVAGRKRIDLEYERRELASRADLAPQELRVRGLPDEQIQAIRKSGRLADTVVVRMPETPRVAESGETDKVLPVAYNSEQPTDMLAKEMTVEKLFVSPGQSVTRGQAMCDLAYHRTLFVVGHAFEADMPAITNATAEERLVAALFGEEGQEGKKSLRTDLPIRFIANHVDPETQTYQVYVTLSNESLHDTHDALGRRYRTWRHKVGQRANLVIPTATLTGQIVLPRGAVVTEGPNAYVFRQHDHDDDHEGHDHAAHDHGEEDHAGHDHDEHGHEGDDHAGHEDIALELEPTPVVIVERSANEVVIAPNGQLAVGDSVAMNNAYQLFLAWKALSETGGGGHHGHSH